MPDTTLHTTTLTRQRAYFIVGLLCLFALLILGGIFFKERVAFGDTAYQAVYLLIEQRPYINWVRAGSIIPQIIPLTAIWSHADLKTVMILHSLSFLIFFFAIYLIAYRYSRRHLLFFIIPLYLVLITNEVFYWPQSELQQGMIWLCLYVVFLYEGTWDNLRPSLFWILHFSFILWIQFFHPLIFFPMIFMVLYYYDGKAFLFSKKSIAHLSICIGAFGIRNIVGMLNKYEKGKLNIGRAVVHNLPHFLSLDSVSAFVHKLSLAYSIFLALLISVTIWLVIMRRYMQGLLLLSFSIGYWALIMITDTGDSVVYTENMLLPLGFIVALPFINDMVPRYSRRLTLTGISILILVRIISIYHAHDAYTARFEAYQPYFKYIDSNKLRGVFVDQIHMTDQNMSMKWASGYESMLLSSLASPDSCKIVQIDKKMSYTGFNENDSCIVTIFGVWMPGQVPVRYFHPRAGRYEILHKSI